MSAYALTNDYAAHFVRRAGCRVYGRKSRDQLVGGMPIVVARGMRGMLRSADAASGEVVQVEGRQLRAAIVPVRLTRGERDQLAEVARDLGLSVSTYMRQVVLARPLPPRRAVRPIPEVNRETYHQLGQLSAELHRIVGLMSRHPTEARGREILEALKLVAQLVSEVRGEVLGTTFTGDGQE